MVRKAVTMRDVADAAGVSRTLVSLVMNERTSVRVADETRARILALASDLGYRPNGAAVALAHQRSDYYGVLTEIVTDPFAVDIIVGAQGAALHHGKHILLASAQKDPAAERAELERLLVRRIDGLIYGAAWHRAVEVPDLAREVPTVLVNCFDVEGRFPAIVPDEYLGGLRATERLLAAGHRRIGFVNIDGEIPAAIGRRRGYQEALRRAGVAIEDRLEACGVALADGGYEAAGVLLDLPEPPTGIFCANDRMAMGAYDAIKERGLRIPKDVAVIGFDNQEVISAFLRPGLTTVALPFDKMGAMGVELLARQSAGESTITKTVMVDCPLLERSSV